MIFAFLYKQCCQEASATCKQKNTWWIIFLVQS